MTEIPPGRPWGIYITSASLILLLAVVNFLIPSPRDPNEPEKAKTAPIADHNFFNAIRQGNAAAVEAFLNSGTSPDSTECGDCGLSALCEASSVGKLEVVKILLRKGATVDIKSQNGSTALVYAVIRRHPDVASELLRAGADPNSDHGSPLFMALTNEDVEMIRLLLDSKANPNILDKNGSTPLIRSLEGNTLPLLFKAKDNINETTIRKIQEQATVNLDIPKLLLEKRADVNLRDSYGATALYYAAKKGRREIVKLLLEAGADPLRATVPWNAIFNDPDIRSNSEVFKLISHTERKSSFK
jgi:ankyrin repeat protein